MFGKGLFFMNKFENICVEMEKKYYLLKVCNNYLIF